MRGANSRPRPGRPPVDIAWRLRNWAWYWSVKRITGCSDDRLDALYVPESKDGTRRRFFQRLRSLGSNPTVARADLSGVSVFQRVIGGDKGQEMQIAERDFHSNLWEMLTNPRLGIEDHRQFINQAIEERGWYRLRAEDRRIAATFLTPDPTFGFPVGCEHVYSAMLTYLELHPTADHVALLAALFREAMTEVALPEAMLLRSSLMNCADNWVVSLGMPVVQQRHLLRLLIEQRLIRGWWFTPDLSLKAYGSQRRYIHALVKAHLATSAEGTPKSYAAWPIVVRSPRVAWIEAHRDVLEAAVNKLYGPDAIGGWKPGDPNVPELLAINPEGMGAYIARLVEGQKAWHAYADWVSKNFKPPPPDMRYCLPVQPGSQGHIDGRALPYLADGHLDTLEGREERLVPEPTWAWGDPPPPIYSHEDDDG